MYRLLPVVLVALAVALFVGAPLLASEESAAKNANSHEGTVVSVDGSGMKLVMKTSGNDAKEMTHTIADNAKITCDGKACKLDDLKAGQKIRVTTKKDNAEMAVRVEALDKNEHFGNRNKGNKTNDNDNKGNSNDNNSNKNNNNKTPENK